MTHRAGPNGSPQQSDEDTARNQTMLEQLGGISGLLYSSLPVVVFVLANAAFGLMPAIWSALGSAVLVTVWRVVRKEPVQPAVSGFFGVAIAAFIAYQTGSAKGYFLFGIWASGGYFAGLGLCVLVRWPLGARAGDHLKGVGGVWG